MLVNIVKYKKWMFMDIVKLWNDMLLLKQYVSLGGEGKIMYTKWLSIAISK